MKTRRMTGMIRGLGFAMAFAAAAAPAFADGATGEQVYKDKQCSLCHKINGSGGKKGPALDTVGDTRDAAWLKKYLVDPKSMMPKGTMPPAKVSTAELKDLVDYLGTLKGGK